MLEKITIVPKQGRNSTEGLSRNIVLQFVVIPYMDEYFSAYFWCIETFLHIGNYSEFQFVHMQNFNLCTSTLFTSASDHDLNTVLWYSFLLQVLMLYLETVPSFHWYLNKIVPKSNRFLDIQIIFQWKIGSEGFNAQSI